MESVLDAFIEIFLRVADSWLGKVAILSPIWLLAFVRIRQALQRRGAFRAFAAARHLEFVGTISSDARAPYSRIKRLGWAGLWNVLEGQWEGQPVHLFDMLRASDRPAWTMVLVTVEGTLRRGAEAERAIATGPAAALIEMNLDILCVSPKRRLEVSELAAWLSFATTLAKAMERDAKNAGPPPDDIGVAGSSRTDRGPRFS